MSVIKNKKLVVSIVFIIIISLIVWFSFHKRHDQNREIDITGKQHEPSFEKEGQLAFIKNNSNDTVILIDIEVADNEEERTQGLMWRNLMPDSNGMLFIFEEERPLSFWMKNTYIPLDIIFVDRTGQIAAVQNNTIPLSETLIPSGKPAQYVIEVNAGFCVNHGITVGDKMMFDTTE